MKNEERHSHSFFYFSISFASFSLVERGCRRNLFRSPSNMSTYQGVVYAMVARLDGTVLAEWR